MSLYALMGAVETGLVFALVALGAFITFRLLHFPDLTVEGSFPLGAAIAATLIAGGGNPWLATAAAAGAGAAAGAVTALLNLRLRIMHILAGILTAIALYSVNMRIMGRPNTPLLGMDTVFAGLAGLGVPSIYAPVVLLLLVVAAATVLLDLFLATGHGLALRSAGANARMSDANGINVAAMVTLGLAIANALTALAGALFAQLLGAADVSMGNGVIVAGLAAVICGTALLPSRLISVLTAACVLGALLYRLAIAIALDLGFAGMTASDVNLVTAALVTLALVAPWRGARARAA